MIDCSKEISAFHNDEVRLSETQRQEMRDRRDANQERLRAGLTKAGKAPPKRHVKQGSYAMHTMVQHPDNHYDIDDGAVFSRDDLKGPKGGDMTPRAARDMVREALDDGSFTTPPETLKNCVRVHYQAGYHVDVPVYREWEDENGEAILELASSEWRKSDPTELTTWFNDAVIAQSPDQANGRQMRRITCLHKKFSRRRPSWNMPSGLIQSVLVDENYIAVDGRDDEVLYDTMKAIHNRLVGCGRQVFNPTDASEELSKGIDDPKMRELEDRLAWALDRLQTVKDESCDRNEALKRWNDVFRTDYFDRFMDEEDDKKGKDERLNVLVSSVAATSPRQWSL